MKNKVTSKELFGLLPGPKTAKWPEGERFVSALRHGSMSVELYAPLNKDPQTPHVQDELYFINSGKGVLSIAGDKHPFDVGTCLFVPAGVEHTFEQFSPDFSTWVVFWGPKGGENAA